MDMSYRYLGRSGLKVSDSSFGSWVTFDNQLDVSRAAECLTATFELVAKLETAVAERIEQILDNKPVPPTDFRA